MMKKKIISMVLVLTMASNPFVGLAPFYVAMDKGFLRTVVWIFPWWILMIRVHPAQHC